MTQKDRILKYLQKGKALNPMGALHLFSSFRLGARIWELRGMGYQIDTKMKKLPSGKYVAEYKLRS